MKHTSRGEGQRTWLLSMPAAIVLLMIMALFVAVFSQALDKSATHASAQSE